MQVASSYIIRCLHTNAKHGIIGRILSSSSENPNHVLSHVVQIGDPVLREVAKPVDENRLSSSDVQIIINQMRQILKKYDAYGISAPQLGVPICMFAMQVTKHQLNQQDDESLKSTGMVETPFKLFINPEVKNVGNETLVEREGCCSMNGYSAKINRHKCVHISGYNEFGERVTWLAKDWNARIVQHEMDHLNGILFTDKMYTPDSLEFKYWKMVNAKNGAFRLHFGGLPGWRQYYYTIPILMMIPIVIIFSIIPYL